MKNVSPRSSLPFLAFNGAVHGCSSRLAARSLQHMPPSWLEVPDAPSSPRSRPSVRRCRSCRCADVIDPRRTAWAGSLVTRSRAWPSPWAARRGTPPLAGLGIDRDAAAKPFDDQPARGEADAGGPSSLSPTRANVIATGSALMLPAVAAWDGRGTATALIRNVVFQNDTTRAESAGWIWYSQGESNPCSRTENPLS